MSGETPGARRRALDAEAARLADELEALPEPPAPEPPRRRGLGVLIAVAVLAALGLVALDLWAFVEARFAASAAQGWIAATLVAALGLVLVLLLLREARSLQRLARVEAAAGGHAEGRACRQGRACRGIILRDSRPYDPRLRPRVLDQAPRGSKLPAGPPCAGASRSAHRPCARRALQIRGGFR